MLRARFSLRFKNPFLPCRWHSSLARASFALFNKNPFFHGYNLLRASFALGCKNSFSSLPAPDENLPEQVSPWQPKTHFRFLSHALVGVICTPSPHSSILQISQPQPFHKNELRDHFFKMIVPSSVTIGSDPGGHGFFASARTAHGKKFREKFENFR